MVRARSTVGALALVAAAALAAVAAPSAGAAVAGGRAATASLAAKAPGTVLRSRTLSYHVVGVPLPVKVVQLVYRSTDALGRPDTNVTSVLEPPLSLGPARAVSYQSFYDSLNPADEPSVQIAGGVTLGGSVADAETAVIAPLLLQGYTVIVPDTEGQAADFAAGPVYGVNTLDAIRAADRSPLTGLSRSTPVGMYGYSGGAIATDWAAQLAPTYAPDVNRQLVGAAEGGVLVDPAHNLDYVAGTPVWAGVIPMSLIGIARAYGVDLSPYLSAYGRQLDQSLQKASIGQVLAQYPGLTFAQLVKPQYADPTSIPILVKLENKLDAGSLPAPTTPMFIGQGANGILEGTPPGPSGIGPGDGVMIAGDVRTLARDFCAAGTAVDYTQYDALSHTTTFPVWTPAALAWLDSRFAGTPAPNDCAQIAPGNSLAPES